MQKESIILYRWLWMTDLHLDFVDDAGLDTFFVRVRNATADGLLISGDIASGTDIHRFLVRLHDSFQGPICFVLGNHDFYGRSFAEVRDKVRSVCAENDRLIYLSDQPGIPLVDDVILVGQDGWGDGRAGDYAASDVEMNDFGLIDELRRKNKAERLEAIKRLGDEEVKQAEPKLRQALQEARDVAFLTHVPPFPEASVGPAGSSDPDFLPFFCCQSMGMMLSELMQTHPDNRLFVFCGHTHSPAIARMLPNLVVRAAGAVYEKPDFAGVVDTANLDQWR